MLLEDFLQIEGIYLITENPIKNFETLKQELVKRKNTNSDLIWSIDKYGDLYIAELPKTGPELNHGILSYGDGVIGVGEIRFSKSVTDYNFHIIANPKTGHYVSRAGAERTPEQFNKDALEALGEIFYLMEK